MQFGVKMLTPANVAKVLGVMTRIPSGYLDPMTGQVSRQIKLNILNVITLYGTVLPQSIQAKLQNNACNRGLKT